MTAGFSICCNYSMRACGISSYPQPPACANVRETEQEKVKTDCGGAEDTSHMNRAMETHRDAQIRASASQGEEWLLAFCQPFE